MNCGHAEVDQLIFDQAPKLKLPPQNHGASREADFGRRRSLRCRKKQDAPRSGGDAASNEEDSRKCRPRGRAIVSAESLGIAVAGRRADVAAAVLLVVVLRAAREQTEDGADSERDDSHAPHRQADRALLLSGRPTGSRAPASSEEIELLPAAS